MVNKMALPLTALEVQALKLIKNQGGPMAKTNRPIQPLMERQVTDYWNVSFTMNAHRNEYLKEKNSWLHKFTKFVLLIVDYFREIISFVWFGF